MGKNFLNNSLAEAEKESITFHSADIWIPTRTLQVRNVIIFLKDCKVSENDSINEELLKMEETFFIKKRNNSESLQTSANI